MSLGAGYPCPIPMAQSSAIAHLAHVDPAVFDEVNLLLDTKNARHRRKPVHGADPRLRVPRKRIRPGDVMSECAQQRKGFCVESLDGFGPIENHWQQFVVEDKRSTPAAIAACRIDFGDWLKLLSKRERKIALTLASGERTSVVAERFGLTSARISQLRLWLKTNWERFPGEADTNEPQLATA